MKIKTIKELKNFISDLPDNMTLAWRDWDEGSRAWIEVGSFYVQSVPTAVSPAIDWENIDTLVFDIETK